MKIPLMYMVAGLFEPYNYESLTVTNAVQVLTASIYKPSTSITKNSDKPAARAIITIETDQIRYRYDGGNPSATVGHLMSPGDIILLVGEFAIKNFKAFRVTTDASIKVTYER